LAALGRWIMDVRADRQKQSPKSPLWYWLSYLGSLVWAPGSLDQTSKATVRPISGIGCHSINPSTRKQYFYRTALRSGRVLPNADVHSERSREMAAAYFIFVWSKLLNLEAQV
jgi:hypothetical protein